MMEQSWQRLQKELEDAQTPDQRRVQIGQELAQMGDPRPGVGVKDGQPDILWLPVAPGGEVTIRRVWHPERLGEEAKVVHRQDFQVAPFYIAQYFVTYAQYQAFVDAADGFDNLIWWRGMPEAYQRQPLGQRHRGVCQYSGVWVEASKRGRHVSAWRGGVWGVGYGGQFDGEVCK